MTDKLNPVVKEKWLEALRNGQYKQGRDQLRDENNNFCCLGVLCNLHAQAHPHLAAYEKDQDHYLGQHTHLPTEVALWAGSEDIGDWFDMPFGLKASATAGTYERRYFQKGGETNLMTLNDSGCNFRQIADVIEAVL